MHFLLKDLKAIIHSIKLAESVLWEEHILHDSEVSIEGKHALSILEPIDPFIDPLQVVVRVALKSISLEEHEVDEK